MCRVALGLTIGWCAFVGAMFHFLMLTALFTGDPPSANDDIQDIIVEALGCIGDPCVIDSNPGGNALTFSKVARLVRAGAIKQVVINGRCASGCAYFADKARPHVCITPNAVFAFHKGRSGEGEDEIMFDLIHSRDIQDWVMKQGGYPKNGMLAMKYKNAKKFWPTCPR